MGYTAAGSFHNGPRAGTSRLADWLMVRYQAGSLGIYNPSSRLGSGLPSLHADGRAFDMALNANDPAQQARGDAAMHELVGNHDAFGLQELLWRGFIWSYQRRGEGIRFGEQQADHMNHVHIGQDTPAADYWSAPGPPVSPAPTPSPEEEDMSAPGFLAKIKDGGGTIWWFHDGQRTGVPSEGYNVAVGQLAYLSQIVSTHVGEVSKATAKLYVIAPSSRL